ncbi:MAG TPA: single-stranded DNA-binding protein [Candidatus Limnocylindria bacterium]|nr:single-stranded DNA-binding protein [Candidatus Limnocylindria bacterium]
MDLNKVMIIGRLTRDPELRATPSGVNVCQIGVATSYVYTNQATGQKVEQTEFHNVVMWRKLGEIAAQYLKKGTQVFIEGRLQTRSWDGKDGQKKNRTEIVADNMIMLQRAAGQSASGGAPSGSYQAASQGYAAPATARPASPAPAQDMSQPAPTEELPTIQQGEDINVEDIPF